MIHSVITETLEVANTQNLNKFQVVARCEAIDDSDLHLIYLKQIYS